MSNITPTASCSFEGHECEPADNKMYLRTQTHNKSPENSRRVRCRKLQPMPFATHHTGFSVVRADGFR